MTGRPDEDWKNNWKLGVDPATEDQVSGEILDLMMAFWDHEGIGERSKSTRQRYAAALEALGGYLVEQAVEAEGRRLSGEQALRAAVEFDEGPAIHYPNEAWQRELDAVCKRLNRYLQGQ